MKSLQTLDQGSPCVFRDILSDFSISTVSHYSPGFCPALQLGYMSESVLNKRRGLVQLLALRILRQSVKSVVENF